MSMIRVAQMVTCTGAEGPGQRFALWFQGCPLRCPGCCNPEMLPFSGGEEMSTSEITAAMSQAKATDQIEGLSLLGGEPFAHAEGAAELAHAARELALSVMVYSGYTLAELRDMADPHVGRLLALTDVLVDGPYDQSRPELCRRWVGSANQVVHFLTDRYRVDDPCWTRPNTLELRLRGNEVTVNGFPAPAAVGLWRRIA